MTAAGRVKVTVDDSGLRKLMAEIAKNQKPVRIVADGVSYGIHNEFGTSNGMSGIFFLARAVDAHRKELEEGLRQAGEDFGRADLVVEKVAREVEKSAKDNIRAADRIDTGAMVNSIHVVDGKDFAFEAEAR